MTVTILVPVLDRPAHVAPLLESIAAATPEPHDVVFLTDEDDHDERAEIRAQGAGEIVCGGSYARKINRGCAETDTPLVFMAADDLRFHPGWLPAATRAMAGPIGVVGTNDLGNRRVMAGEHATHSLAARAYLEQGAIDGGGPLHEGYHHNFVDDEFVATAKRRRAWAFAPDSVVEHLHPNWGKAPADETYALGQARWRVDRRTFHRRRHLWT